MHEHQTHDQAQYAAFRQFQRRGPSASSADDLSTLADLKDRGLLTNEEFDRAKAKAVG